MEELFSEVLIKKKKTTTGLLLQILPFALGAVCVLGGVLVHPFLMLAGIILIGLGVWLKPRQDIEYEYSYVNGSLDVDCIYGKKSRKRLDSLDLCQMEIMAPAGSPFLDNTGGRTARTLDYTSGEKDDAGEVYAAILPHGGQRTMLLFQPSESMKKDLRMRAPSKVHL